MNRSLCVVRMRTAQAAVRAVADDLETLSLSDEAAKLLADIRGEIAEVQESGEKVIHALGTRAILESQTTYHDHLRPSMDRLR